MRKTLWAIDRLYARRVADMTRDHLRDLTRSQEDASRRQSARVLDDLAAQAGPHVDMGDTEWGQRVLLPLNFLSQAHSVITGGTGTGKTRAALNVIDAILRSPDVNISVGVVDPKNELFAGALALIARRMAELPPGQAAALAERIVIIDLSSQDPLTSYNVADLWPGSDLDYFATSRVETLQELLPSGDGLSLRGGVIAKVVLKLLAEQALPFSYFERVLSSETLRARLLARTRQEDVRQYFREQFANEPRSTLAAVRARITSALMNFSSIRLALSGPTAPDFRRYQDEGKLCLINCAGPNIPRTTAQTLQSLILSDIRQSIFARNRRQTYLWICDEAQNFFRTRHLRENMTSILTMSRSFGSFFLYLTQNLGTAVQDGEVLEALQTNMRWSLSLRGTPRDCAFLQPALPLTGCMARPRANRYDKPEYYSPSEERSLLMNSIAHLPDREGWLWLKSLTGEAMKIKTRTLDLPEGEDFREAVDRIRGDARIGGRMRRSEYLADLEHREAELTGNGESTLTERLRQAYRQDQEVMS